MTIHGHVTDPHGQPVAEAAVYVISAPVSMPDIAQLTDDGGRFTIAAPAPGHYTVGVRSDEWGSAQKDVEVGDGESTVEVEISFS